MGRKRKKRNTLLVDADILVFRIAIAEEEAICWDTDNELWTLHADLKQAKAKVQDEVAHLCDVLGGVSVIMCFSPRKTFRHELFPRYKAHRKDRKPTIFPALREWVISEWRSECWPNVEADDIIGILAKSHSVPAPKIVVSDDHDMESIPCMLYQPMHPERGVRRVTYANARRYHLTQTLTGDSGDGYPGLPGVGPKRAEAILKQGLWEEVVDAYEKKGLNETEALLQARLAKILTPKLYDQKTHKVTLWNPRKHR
ncbi:hypothetical protein CMI37_27505 [Candidatus Pacearchaeota archaeon]|nr:hypothetical protein [Candidatus Pacearchaeota archaeon]|tara:strand:- start:4320 stop:5087 length:768 start_codon:yes stop_codon:yes gene_type:complete